MDAFTEWTTALSAYRPAPSARTSAFEKWASQLKSAIEKPKTVQQPQQPVQPAPPKPLTQQPQQPQAPQQQPKQPTAPMRQAPGQVNPMAQGTANPDYAAFRDAVANRMDQTQQGSGRAVREQWLKGMQAGAKNTRNDTGFLGIFKGNIGNKAEYNQYKARWDAMMANPQEFWKDPAEGMKVMGYMQYMLPNAEYNKTKNAIMHSMWQSAAAGVTGNLFGARDAMLRSQQQAAGYIGEDDPSVRLMRASNAGMRALTSYYTGRGMARFVVPQIQQMQLAEAMSAATRANPGLASNAMHFLARRGLDAGLGLTRGWTMASNGALVDAVGQAGGWNGLSAVGQSFERMPTFNALMGATGLSNLNATRFFPNSGKAQLFDSTIGPAMNAFGQTMIANTAQNTQATSPIVHGVMQGDARERRHAQELNDTASALQWENPELSNDEAKEIAREGLAADDWNNLQTVLDSVKVEGNDAKTHENQLKVFQSYVNGNGRINPEVFKDPRLSPQEQSDLARRFVKSHVVDTAMAGDNIVARGVNIVTTAVKGTTQSGREAMLWDAVKRDPAVAEAGKIIMSNTFDNLSREDYKPDDKGPNSKELGYANAFLDACSQEQVDECMAKVKNMSDKDLGTMLRNISSGQRGTDGNPSPAMQKLMANPKLFNAVSKVAADRMANPDSVAALLPDVLKMSQASGGGLDPQYLGMLMGNAEKIDWDGVMKKLDSKKFFDVLQMMTAGDGSGAAKIKSILGDERYAALEQKVTAAAKSAVFGKILENPANLHRAVGLWLSMQGGKLGEFGRWIDGNPVAFYGGVAALLGLGGMLMFSGGDEDDEEDEERTASDPARIDRRRLAAMSPDIALTAGL